MTVALMLNRKAGTGRANRLADYVFDQFSKNGIDYIFVEATSAQDAIEKASAIAHQVEAFVAVGGDGSVHTAAQVAWKHKLPLGIIASGSGDDIARACGLPHGRRFTHIQKAVDHFVESWLKRDISHVDVLAATTGDGKDHAVLAVLSAGFDSRVSVTSQSMLYIRGTLRYIVAMVNTLRAFTPIHYELNIDGAHKKIRAMMVAVGTGSMFGGGMKVLPDAVVNDGELDMIVVNEVSIPTFLTIFPKVFNGSHVTHPVVDTHRVKQVSLHAEGEQVWGDGEYLGMSPVQINVDASGISVVGARI
jgi:diacylglycerol kinase (ATP)